MQYYGKKGPLSSVSLNVINIRTFQIMGTFFIKLRETLPNIRMHPSSKIGPSFIAQTQRFVAQIHSSRVCYQGRVERFTVIYKAVHTSTS